ncbi:NRDE family protein [Arhodomonas sp. SL1]|uniref:NRDE family protein n=1 Tax=Arhodomonas sp. SL1 TaxID=3425691 RepID=UPI003F881E06
MCLILVAVGVHPRYPLVVAANRDEFHERPAEPARWWPDRGVLAGRDARAGGTWLAVDRRGRFAAVTNFRDPSLEQAPRSRGELPLELLEHPELDAGREAIAGRMAQYGGFNLLGSDGRALVHLCNRTAEQRTLPPGVYGLSNHTLDTPWPKVRRGREGLQALLHRPTVDPEALLALLADRRGVDDEALPDTGVPLEWERRLAPMFIVSEGYGTRASTAYLLDAEGEATFVERRFRPDGSVAGETRDAFRVASGGVSSA